LARFFVKTGGNIGIGTTAPAANLHISNGVTGTSLFVDNTYTDASNYERLSIGWAANLLTISTQAAGTGTVRNINLAANTVSVTGTLSVSADINAGAGNAYTWQGRAKMYSGADGVITLSNAASAGFTRLNFGAIDSTGPALSRSGTTLSVTDGAGAAGGIFNVTGSLYLGSSALTLTSGAVGLPKMSASASAPGAAGSKLEVVCGTNAGTAKLIMYAGTSGTAVTVIDNVGAGVSGC